MSEDKIAEIDKAMQGDLRVCNKLGDAYKIGLSGPDKNYAKARYYQEKVCTKDKSILDKIQRILKAKVILEKMKMSQQLAKTSGKCMKMAVA